VIKAIETMYNGYRFRSRLEARWAVFFDELSIKYEYEKEGYDLGELGYYLPDFWLPYPLEMNFSGYENAGHWIEVKGITPTDNELLKLQVLTKFTKHTTWCVVGAPGKHTRYYAHHSGNCGWMNKDTETELDKAFDTFALAQRFTEQAYRYMYAIAAANQARFEHGQIGAPSEW